MPKSGLSPIVLFVYNRVDHTKRTVEALKNNFLSNQSDLFIFSDGSRDKKDLKKVNEVRKYIHSINGFKSIKIIESKKNKGLANSIIFGVTKIVNKYGKVIVLEDDIVTSKYFLKYMNDALEKYANTSVACITGYVYPVKNLPNQFFLKGADCWSWATWKNKWVLFEEDGKKLLDQLEKNNLIYDFDFYGEYKFSIMLKDQIAGKNNSWAVRWYASAYLKNNLCLYPGKSLVNNIGNDSSGTHNKTKTNWFDSKIDNKKCLLENICIEENIIAKKQMSKFFKRKNNMFFKILKKLRVLFWIKK